MSSVIKNGLRAESHRVPRVLAQSIYSESWIKKQQDIYSALVNVSHTCSSSQSESIQGKLSGTFCSFKARRNDFMVIRKKADDSALEVNPAEH